MLLPVVTVTVDPSDPSNTLKIVVCFGFVGVPHESVDPGTTSNPDGGVTVPGLPFQEQWMMHTSPDAWPEGRVTTCDVVVDPDEFAAARNAMAN